MRGTHSTLVAKGRSAAAGAQLRPMLEQLTPQCPRGPAGRQVQFPGQGLQPGPCSPVRVGSSAASQQNTSSRAGSRPGRWTRAPCPRLGPPGSRRSIAQSQLILRVSASLGPERTINVCDDSCGKKRRAFEDVAFVIL